jgi:hypothetical protein
MMMTHFYKWNHNNNRAETYCELPFTPIEMENEQYGTKSFSGMIYTIKRLNAIITTDDLNSVDCQQCIINLKKEVYHCDNHGFIDCTHVTFSETCDICNSHV